ncbi:MAG TPA: hypothetical protein VFY93_13880 [Planctomycetota bacterium]|nr:hypothetical protein [Planctomycetota bacterium]
MRLLRRWWVRWIVLPLVALVGAHQVWTLTLKWEFERRITKLRAAGEPVDLGDLRRPRIPDEDNAAALWEEAHEWYEEHLHTPAVLVQNTPEDIWDEGDREAVAEYLGGGDPYVDLLARAAAKPDMWQDLEWEKGAGMEVTAIPQMQDAMGYLEHRARCAERGPDAVRFVAIMLDLAPKLERSCLILVLVRWMVDRTAADAIKVLFRKPGFDAREARACLDPRLARIDDGSDLRKAFEGERVMALSVSRRWIAGESPLRIMKELSGDDGARDDAESAADRLAASCIVRPFAYRDALRLLDVTERAIVIAGLPSREAIPAAEALRDEDRAGVLNLASQLWAGLPVKAVRERPKHDAYVRIARVGLALLAIKQETGEWPETLDAVVPLVGEACLEDPYTGERLQYEPGVRVQAAVPIPEWSKDMPEEYEIVWRFGG